MAKKKAAKEGEQPDLELAEEETLPPPDPPKAKSEPTEPAAFDAVDDSPKGADPEDPNATFELDLLHHESIRGTGPRPEEAAPQEAAPGEEPKKEKEKEE